jgi:hypothetical protein
MNPALFKAKVPALMKQFMADFDCTKEDAAAVFGNAGHESGGFTQMQEIRPTVAGSRGGFGWFQWTGPRRRQFEGYCERNSLDPISDKANYGFLWLELKGPEKAALPRMRLAKTLRDKVIEFELAYERAGIKHYDSRVKWANIALGAFEAKYGAGLATKPKPMGRPGGAVVAGGTAGTSAGAAAQQAGLPIWSVVVIAIVVAALAAFITWKIKK